MIGTTKNGDVFEFGFDSALGWWWRHEDQEKVFQNRMDWWNTMLQTLCIEDLKRFNTELSELVRMEDPRCVPAKFRITAPFYDEDEEIASVGEIVDGCIDEDGRPCITTRDGYDVYADVEPFGCITACGRAERIS